MAIYCVNFGVNFILQKFCLCKKMTNMRYGLFFLGINMFLQQQVSWNFRPRVCIKWKTREMKVFATLEFFLPMDRKKTVCAYSSWGLTCCSFHSTILFKYIIPDILSAYFCCVQNIPEYCNLIPDILCTLNLKDVLMDSHLNLPLPYSNIFISQIATLWQHM